MTKPPEFRSDLSGIAPYRAGRRPQKTDGEVYSLASNETTFGPLPGVMHASQSHLAQSHRYPDPGVTQLAAALSDRYHVDPDWISTGTGSVAICQQAIVAACSPGDEVIFAWRSFEAYPIITKLAAAKAVQVPLLTNGRHDLSAMAAAITEKTKVIFVCSPNNPTGPTVRPAELADFLELIPARVLVVLDEAYYEFAQVSADAQELADGVQLAKQHHNVLALRTFSKAYGLAGLRVGYGIASPTVTQSLRKTSLPFGVSAVAQAAAVASLAAENTMRERVRSVVIERDRVTAAARDSGWNIPQARGNFYWIPLGMRTLEFANACLERGVSVRAFPDEGVRVTIGEPVANDRVLELLLGQFHR